MREVQLRRALVDLAEHGVPTEPDIWPGIRARLVGEPARLGERQILTREFSRARILSPWTFLPARTVVLALILIGVALAGTGYAALPLIQRQLSDSPEGQQMLAYGETMHLTQTVHEITISLDFAYADRTGGLLGYTITARGGRTYSARPDKISVTTSNGAAVPITGGSGTGRQAGATGNFVSFGGITAGSGQPKVPLHLNLGAVESTLPDGTTQTVPGPWVFGFTAPVAPTRIIEPTQTAVADGWPITLASITMTPPATWITLRGTGPDAEVELIAGGKTYRLYQNGLGGGPEVKTCFAARQRCPELWKGRDTT